MKILLDVFGPANKGKSTAIIDAFCKLSGRDEKDFFDVDGNLKSGDITEVLTINGKKVGFVSHGDNGNNKNILSRLVEKKCDIIVCASRTRGSSLNNVKEIAEHNSFQIVYLSPFCYYNMSDNMKQLQGCLKGLNGTSIANFINEIIKY